MASTMCHAQSQVFGHHDTSSSMQTMKYTQPLIESMVKLSSSSIQSSIAYAIIYNHLSNTCSAESIQDAREQYQSLMKNHDFVQLIAQGTPLQNTIRYRIIKNKLV